MDTMRHFLKKLGRLLWGRVARNIYFWAFLIYLMVIDRSTKYVYPAGWYYFFTFLNIGIIFCASYFNSLVLVPRLSKRKRHFVYFLCVFAVAGLGGFLHLLSLKEMVLHFPKMSPGDVSFINGPMSPDLSSKAFWSEISTYWTVYLIWMLMFTMAWYMNDYSRQEQLVEESRKKQIETELSFLKSQINPHFLFNTLNNLYGLALKKADTAPEAILKLSVILRYLLYDSNTAEVPFEKEKEIMQAYIDLELLRLADNEQLHFSISADNSCKVPPLLWLPVLENVFKHGTRFISTECFVDYRFMIVKNKLTIYARNRYKNVPSAAENDKVGGIGLSNLRKRLDILYPEKHKINIVQDEDYYVTEVHVALG